MLGDSLFVVSDVHLGGEGSCVTAFSDFLCWLADLEQKKRIVVHVSGGEERVVSFPSKIILLGDILELWDPIGDDRRNVLLDSFKVFGQLVGLGCDKIYVLGNHDQDQELEYLVGEYICPNGSKFRIIARHYPEDPEKDFETLGGNSYFFLHGHQFDKLFRWTGPLQAIPGVMASVASIVDKPRRFKPYLGSLLALICIAFVFLLVHKIIVYVKDYFWGTTSWSTPGPLLAVLTPFSFFGLSWLFVRLQTPLWKHCLKYFVNKPKFKDINTIVEEKYYDKRKDSIVANVIIFGHTHIPEESGEEIERSLNKKFVNTGSWVSSNSIPIHNTFVYIDEEGPEIFYWDEKNKTIKHFEQKITSPKNPKKHIKPSCYKQDDIEVERT